jgi:hypothetical protein
MNRGQFYIFCLLASIGMSASAHNRNDTIEALQANQAPLTIPVACITQMDEATVQIAQNCLPDSARSQGGDRDQLAMMTKYETPLLRCLAKCDKYPNLKDSALCYKKVCGI